MEKSKNKSLKPEDMQKKEKKSAALGVKFTSRLSEHAKQSAAQNQNLCKVPGYNVSCT